MNNVHSIIFAYHTRPDMGELCKFRTAAALPFCGRYRLIDLALSGLMHAGLYNVDVLMQFGYQPLIDHISGGRTWDMIRHSGGIHMMVAQPEMGFHGGSMASLSTDFFRLKDEVRDDYVLLTRGDLVASIDMAGLVEQHMASGADVTVACATRPVPGVHNHFIPGEGNMASELRCYQTEKDPGYTSLETYILRRDKLLELMQWCAEGSRIHFHRDALMHMMNKEGWTVDLFKHDGYARYLYTFKDYFDANMDMLDPEKRRSLFPKDRPVATRARSDVSTYYSDSADVTDSLVTDGCIVEGKVDRCILCRGVRIEAGADLKDSIILNDSVVGAGTVLRDVIVDKDAVLSPGLNLAGNPNLPLVVPKRARL